MLHSALGLALSITSGGAVPRWHPFDVPFRAERLPEQPFLVRFEADVTGPAGESFRLPGFWDGGEFWTLRVAPTAPGVWQVRTRSDFAPLDGQSFEFTAEGAHGFHGGIRVDPGHPHHFVYEDGARRFMLAYECDWLFALPDPTRERFLDVLDQHGFSDVILNVYAHDTGWRPGKSETSDYGPPPLYPWEGSNEAPDFTRFNLAYWRHYDEVIQSLARRGLAAHLFIKVYNKQVTWPERRSADEDRFLLWLIARYAAFPNVIWDLSKEAYNEKDVEYKLDRLRFIREHDPYRRLLTVHDDDACYDAGQYDELLDFHTDQNHSRFHARILEQRTRRAWPIFNSEFGYEHGPGGLEDKTYRVVQPPEEVARRAWEVYLAGGYGCYYYTYTAWDVIRAEAQPPGYALMRHLAQFFRRTGYWRMEPRDDLIAGEGAHCLAAPGQEYIAYVPDGRAFALKVAHELRGEWYRCFTGERVDAGVARAGEHTFAPPEAWRGEPVALHLGEAPEGMLL